VYAEWLGQESSRIWLAETSVGQSPIGYLVSMPSRLSIAHARNDDLEVKRIYLLHRFRGNGLGRRLMHEVERSARARGFTRLLLGVYSRNRAAIAFYERLGFHKVGDRTFKVGTNSYEDIVMGLSLAPAHAAARGS
jgi:ribosomal protein S18 acetylase RimI-like enzyme